MGRWIHKVNIHQHLGEGEDRESIESAYAGICDELKNVPGPQPSEFHRRANQAIELEDVEIFNLGMAHLYDWADDNRIWLGA